MIFHMVKGLRLYFLHGLKQFGKKIQPGLSSLLSGVMDVDLEYYDQEAIIFGRCPPFGRIFTSIGLPTRLHQIGIDNNDFEKMSKAVERIKKHPLNWQWKFIKPHYKRYTAMIPSLRCFSIYSFYYLHNIKPLFDD